MAGLVKNRTNQYKEAPAPGGMNAGQASSVYQGFYGELPMPATSFVTSTTAVKSVDIVPSVGATTDAAIVDRSNRMNGYLATGGFSERDTGIPQMYNSPYSSKFQPLTVGWIVNYVINACLYRAGYPAATVMNGGRRNMALSTRVDQLVTRSSGGPGPAQMTSAPKFKRVQTVPRFSTMPQAYPTQGAPG
jgi:hypothetical protein